MSARETAQIVVNAILCLPKADGRRLIAIAGPPAVGKSTVAAHVADALTNHGVPSAIVPMDGFHFDNAHLKTLGLLHRKGAPDTFDLAAFRAKLIAVKQGGDVKIPLFDRDRDCTLPDAGLVPVEVQTIIVEGNYLLLNQGGWRDLLDLWDFTVLIKQDVNVLKTRLTNRWLKQGLSQPAALSKAEINDLPNAELILGQSAQPGIEITN